MAVQILCCIGYLIDFHEISWRIVIIKNSLFKPDIQDYVDLGCLAFHLMKNRILSMKEVIILFEITGLLSRRAIQSIIKLRYNCVSPLKLNLITSKLLFSLSLL